MNKTSRSQNYRLIRTTFIFALCALLGMFPVQPVRADGAPPPEPDMGGVAPYQPIETNVQMMSETVVIDVLPNPTRWTSTEFSWNPNKVRVSASFTLRNQGTKEEKMQVIFPLTRLDYPWLTSSYNIIGSSFVASVDGSPIPTTPVSTPPELQALPEGSDMELPDGFFTPDVQWAGFDVTFPVHEDVIVQVEYDMWGDITTGLHHVDYILETGAGWYGNILSADFIVRFPYPATDESILETPTGCTFSGNEVQCTLKNFEPTRKDNLTFGFIDTNEWSPTLELRSRMEQYPDDVDAWYKLGNKYARLGFWHGPSGGASIRDQHLVDLAIEAFEKAIDLKHNWGEAHLGLAHALWFSNPKLVGTENIARTKLTTDDPVVQQVLLEMQLAASHGIGSYNYYYEDISREILRTIPDLNQSLLPAPIQLTFTPALSVAMPESISDSIQKVNMVAAGNYHTCVLTSSEVKCNGWNLETRVIGDFAAIVAGDYYTCLLTTNGGVKCMGKNNFGQLGNGTTTDRATSVDVLELTEGVSALVAGDNHTCALTTGGGVKCWGRNYFGQLGNGTTAYSLVPIDVHGLTSGVASLIAGSDHTCALMMAGGIKCWGANEAGQLGDGSLVNRLEPVDISGLPKDVISLAAGFAHTCALTSQGQVMCWGDNSHGQLGDENPVPHKIPVIVPGLDRDVAKLVAGNGYSCALTTKGGVKCWGRKQLFPDPSGNGITPPEQFMPYDVDELASNVVNLTAGNDHICGLLQNGRVKCWGLIWFAYNGPEVQFDGEPTATPPDLASILPTYTPMPLLTAVPTEIPSPTKSFVWGFVLLAAVGLLVLLIRRYKDGTMR